MRALLALILVLGTAGCTDADWTHVANFVTPDAMFGGDSALDDDRAPAVSHSNARCEDVASDRSADVAQQGFDSDIRRAVYDSTYADCVAWAARGTSVTTR
ncbi:MAG: hypothetical protein ACXWLD_02845 [Rhizomicrobium sp.]